MPHDHPQTPQSPSQRSPGIADQPPKPTYTETNDSLLTPAHSISGSMSSTHPEYIHDGSSKTETGVGGDFSNKRKRELEDNGDREQKKVHVEDSIIGIDALHFEVGPKYLFMQTPHPIMNPNTSLDLFELYNHQAIVESVARWKPDAKAPDGRAKNAMRKTFKNKIKAAGVNGNFDYKTDEVEQKNKIPKLGQLIHMMVIDEEEFNELHPWGKDIDKGLDALLPNIDKALTMAKGVIPKTIFDSSVLGEIGAPSSAKQVPKQNGARTPIPQASHGGTPRPKSELPRPKRNVKKRTYGDSSYEGYGEGYVDDDAPDGGYSTNDDSRKRPKKSVQGHLNATSRQTSYGPGSIGA